MAIEQTNDTDADRDRVLRSFVVEVVALPTGPDLVTGLERLTSRGDLSAREAAEVTAAWNRMIGYCQAGRLAAVVDLDSVLNPDLQDPTVRLEGGRSCPVRRTADELAPLLRIAPQAASRLVGLARRVETTLPAAFDALAEGRLDYTQLGIVDQVVRDLPAGALRLVEAAGVRAGPSHTAQQLRDYLQAEAQRVDPAHAAKAAARGIADRDVVLRPSPLDGCRRLVADLPAENAAAAWTALNSAAKVARKTGTRPDGTREDRTCAQLRADLLTCLLTGQVDWQHHPPGAGDKPDYNPSWVPTPQDLARLAEVQVVVAADTLLCASDLPAHIPGVGPLDVATVRDLASRARWRRLICDPDTGTLIHADPATRGPDGHDPNQPPPKPPDDGGGGPRRPRPPSGGRGPGGGARPGAGSGGPSAGTRGRGAGTRASSGGTGPGAPSRTTGGRGRQGRASSTTGHGAGGGEHEACVVVSGEGRADPATLQCQDAQARAAEGRSVNPACPSAPGYALDARWVGVLTDPVRPAVLDHGTTRYVPPARLRLHVHTRDATCVGAACHHPATGTQLDHTVNYGQPDEHGRLGATSDRNLASVCERSHNSKTHGGWMLAQPSPGTFVWTSPTGLIYTRTARPLVPGWQTLNHCEEKGL